MIPKQSFHDNYICFGLQAKKSGQQIALYFVFYACILCVYMHK